MTIKHKSINYEIKSIDEAGFFEGYANVKHVKDHASDMTVDGAFTQSLLKHKDADTMPLMFWNHKTDEPIGVWTEMFEDDHGLYIKGQLLVDDIAKAKEIYALMKRKAITGLSIGYVVQDESFERETNTNLLKSVHILEVSVVSFACNEQSQVEVVKSRFATDEMPSEREFEKALRELGLSRKQAKTFMFEGYKSLAANDENDPLNESLNTIEDEATNEKAKELLLLLKSL